MSQKSWETPFLPSSILTRNDAKKHQRFHVWIRQSLLSRHQHQHLGNNEGLACCMREDMAEKTEFR
jgi:hypothetical protein